MSGEDFTLRSTKPSTGEIESTEQHRRRLNWEAEHLTPAEVRGMTLEERISRYREEVAR